MFQSTMSAFSDPATFGKVVEIILLNIILSGDNAVVIALACRGLPDRQRTIGIALGALVAVVLRVVFTVTIASLLNTPFLRIAGALLLFYIAVKLLIEDGGESEDSIKSSDQLWKAVQTVAIADIVMSLDNVLAIAAVAKDSIALLILGLVISIPLIVVGASLITSILTRYPVLIWVGGALLGWVAGEMLVSDPFLIDRFGAGTLHAFDYPAAVTGAVFVVAVGWLIKRRRVAQHAS